jgi:hypothetical protein
LSPLVTTMFPLCPPVNSNLIGKFVCVNHGLVLRAYQCLKEGRCAGVLNAFVVILVTMA